jgi:hypothetical protein
MKTNDSSTRRRPSRKRKAKPGRAPLLDVRTQPKDTCAETSPAQTPAAVLDDYMETEQLAAELNMTPLTLIRWRLEKKGPPVTRIGRRILYRRSSVKAWMAAQEQRWT